MAITFPLAFPSRNPEEFSLRGRNVVGVNTAPTTLIEQRYKWQGERWEGAISFGTQRRSNGEVFAAFLTALQGAYGTFLAGDPAAATPRGSAGVTPGVPTLSGLHAIRTRTLALTTGLASVTGYLRAGDYISFGSGLTRRLHKVLQDVNLVGGAASVEIWPGLRSAYSSGTAVVVSGATGKFRLASDPEWSTSKGGPDGSLYSFAPVSVVEDLS